MMAKVIRLESKRRGARKANPPPSGSAQILIFNGVRIERLETKKRVRVSKKHTSRGDKVAV